MRTLSLLFGLSLLGSMLFMDCSRRSQLSDFSSDGCSLFPDQSLINIDNWSACCLEHDLAYWQGGTKAQRDSADRIFKQCILEKTNDPDLAELMYNAVRIGGSPYFPTWYRWGYGWTYARGYKPLTPEEKYQVQQKLEAYFKK